MPWAILRTIFFCCQESDEIQEPFDESSHLIPSESVESPMIYSNVVLPDNRQLKERMGLIVRTKEGKMVNVASQIPFNLHNTVVPPAQSYGSVSRSTSGSLDRHHHNFQTDYSKHGIGHQQNFYVSGFNDRSRSASPSSGPSHTKCLSQTSTPILNVRLVGYADNITKSRGRTLSRSTDIPNLTHGTTRIEGEGVANAENSCEGLTAASAFKLRDVGSITLNWND